MKISLVTSNQQIESRSFLSYQYSQLEYESIPHNRFRLYFTKADHQLIRKIDLISNGILGQFATGRTGVRSKIGQKNIINKEQNGKTWAKGLISGASILRYAVSYDGFYINIDPALLNAGGWDYDIIHNPKILVRQTSDRLTASIDKDSFYHLNNIHSFSLKVKDLALEFILSIFNSKLLNYYYQTTTLEKGRTMAQTDIETLELLPIKKISPEAQKPFIDLVDQILEITSATDYNPKNPPVKQKELEKQIDELVYELYDLTPEEIKIVENSGKKNG